MTRDLLTITKAKQEAKRMRATLTEQGEAISHALALERVAQRHGFRDWNAFHAEMRDRPPPGWTAGGRVKAKRGRKRWACGGLRPRHPGISVMTNGTARWRMRRAADARSRATLGQARTSSRSTIRPGRRITATRGLTWMMANAGFAMKPKHWRQDGVL